MSAHSPQRLLRKFWLFSSFENKATVGVLEKERVGRSHAKKLSPMARSCQVQVLLVGALEAEPLCASRQGTHLPAGVSARGLLLGNPSVPSFSYVQAHIKLVQGGFPIRYRLCSWCRAVCGLSPHPCRDGDRHPARCMLLERCHQHGVGSGMVFLQGAPSLRILAPQPEPSAAGPAQDANAVQNFLLMVGSGYYYTKQNKLRSLISGYLWIWL